MTAFPTNLLLADAVRTNGARLIAAGGGFPDRLGPEDEYAFDTFGDSGSICFAANDRDFWVAATNNARKYSFAGALLATTGNIAAILGMSRLTADKLLISRQAVTGFAEYTESTDTIVARTAPAALRYMMAGPTTATYWSCNASTTITELDSTTLVATGRVITLSASAQAIWTSAADGTWGVYANVTGVGIDKWEDVAGTMTKNKTWTANAIGSAPGSAFGTMLIVDASGKPVVYSQVSGSIDRFSVAGGAQAAVAERLVWGGPEIGGPGATTIGAGSQSAPPFAFSQDGKYFAYLTPSADMATADKGVKVKNLQVQRAEWTLAVSGGTLMDISIPGNLSNGIGLTNGWRNGTTQDFRRAKPFYQRVGIDGSRVYPQEWAIPQAGLTLAGASALKVGVDFDLGFGKPGGPPPYIGGSSGEGPRVWIDSGISPRRHRLQGGL